MNNTLFSRIVNIFPKVPLQLEGFVRFASKKAAGSSRNPKQARGKHRGWKKQDGTYVYAGELLAKMNKPNWLPGLNAEMGTGRNMYLRAMKDGTVRVTCEIPDLDYNNPGVEKFFGNRDRGIPFFKKYFHVIPREQHTRFKLIDQV